MRYVEQYNKAREKGNLKSVTTDIYTWEAEGQELVGKIQEIQPFVFGKKFDTEVKQYIMDTDEGLVSTVLGAATDKQIEGKVKVGSVVAIIFHGKKQLDDGRQVNKFEVIIL